MKINKAFIYFIVLLIIVVGIRCKSVRISSSQTAMYKSIYIDQFKLKYFTQMLINGYNNSQAIQEIISIDHSGFTEPILTEDDYNFIDSITRIDNQKMQSDSANSIGRVAEGAKGKHILGFVLGRISSKWLDSLANKRYKNAGVEKMYKD